MSTPALPVLNYAGPTVKVVRSRPYLLLELAVRLLKAAWILLRIALLLAGFVLTIAGTILLIVGGQRSAGRAVRQRIRYAAGVLRLWREDIARPLRQWWAAYKASFSVPAT